MVIYIDRVQYKKLVKKYCIKEEKLKNAFIAFLSGGFLGMLMQFISSALVKCLDISISDSYSITSIMIIFSTCFCTGLGFFDNLIVKFKCGLIIPTTGFAHSVSACTIDYKKDGMITGIGSNYFKLAGSVIAYGIIFSFFLVLLKVAIIY